MLETNMDRRFSSSFPIGIPIRMLLDRFNKVPKPKLIVFDLGRNVRMFTGYAITVKSVVNGHSKKDQKLVFKTDYRLMQVKCIAECSKRAFCNTFDLHLATICL